MAKKKRTKKEQTKKAQAGNKTLVTTVKIWPKANGEICVRFADAVMSTVSAKPSSDRYHPHLFGKLQTLLALR